MRPWGITYLKVESFFGEAVVEEVTETFPTPLQFNRTREMCRVNHYFVTKIWMEV